MTPGSPTVPPHRSTRPQPEPGRSRVQRSTRLRRTSLAALILLVLVVFGLFSLPKAGPVAPTPPGAGQGPATTDGRLPFASPSGHGMRPGPNLAPGSDPAVLPGDVLVADEENDRLVAIDPAGNVVWQFPQPGDLVPGQSFLSPDDAFFTPKGTGIIATEETDQVVSLISLAPARLLWRYGQPGVAGAGPGQLSNPDDAMMAPNGYVIVADIRNCSLLVLRTGQATPVQRIGIQDTACLHSPPLRFGSPNGAFPLMDGNYIVTEINGDWVDEMSLSGQVLWSTHPPGVAYPSDTNEVSPGVYLSVDYSNPGQIVEFDRQGHLLWRYGPSSGPGKLNDPSLCEPIPTSGDILCNDDADDRVIVVDPRLNRIVWQYGHDGVSGRGPGYLAGPDGVDLAPPYSLLVRHARTMGLPTLTCAPGLPSGACTVFPGP